MRFDLEEVPAKTFPRVPQVGDVYSAKGGSPTALWVMVAQGPSSGHYLGIDATGEIVSTATYAHHAMATRAVVGRVDLSELLLPIFAD